MGFLKEKNEDWKQMGINETDEVAKLFGFLNNNWKLNLGNFFAVEIYGKFGNFSIIFNNFWGFCLKIN